MANYKEQIAKSGELLRAFRKDKELFNKEKDILEICKQRYQMCWSQIHEVLVPKKTESGEKEIRDIIKGIFALDLPICEAKIDRFKRAIEAYEKRKDADNVELCYQYLQEWLMLYDDNYALVAFRSLEHYALYLEWDKPETGEYSKIWKYSIDPFNDNGWSGCTKGFWYYANQMILNNNVKFLMKQMPTSFGKSYSDSVMISFLYGIEPTVQILKVVGNKSLMPKCTNQVVNIMTHPSTRRRYLKVFPQFLEGLDEDTRMLVMTESTDISRLTSQQLAQYTKTQERLKAHIFSVCKIQDGMFTIRISGRDTSFECITKDLDRDGIACTWLFLDDIVQRSEIMKIDLHNKDIKAFDGTWKKRCRDEKQLRIVVGGTTYDPYDLLVTLKDRYSEGKVKQSPINKYTTMSLDESAVFVSVPKLDENDQLTFPHKTVLSSVLKDRQNDPELFWAMDMQLPMPPKDNPFYWEALQLYEAIPEEREEFCYASVDLSRTGFDNNSMPILCKCGDLYYLKSAMYEQNNLDDAYKNIVQLVKDHKIVKLIAENNIETSIKSIIEGKLADEGIHYCEVIPVYSTEKKEQRIYAMGNAIRKQIVFPAKHLYSPYSQMGKFMLDVVGYRNDGKNKHDDSIDSLALFAQKVIVAPEGKKKAKIIQM